MGICNGEARRKDAAGVLPPPANEYKSMIELRKKQHTNKEDKSKYADATWGFLPVQRPAESGQTTMQEWEGRERQGEARGRQQEAKEEERGITERSVRLGRPMPAYVDQYETVLQWPSTSKHNSDLTI